MLITDKQEIERRVKKIRLRAVILKDRVLDVKRTTGIDMREEIMEFFRSRFEEKEKVNVADQTWRQESVPSEADVRAEQGEDEIAEKRTQKFKKRSSIMI